MKILNLFSLALIFAFLYACGSAEQSADTENKVSETPATETTAASADGMNSLTEQEQQDGWSLLFDGESFENWRGANQENFPEQGWHVEDGLLVVEAADGAESGNGGDIVTENEYKDFEFMVDFRITEGANSGIKYYVTEQYGSDKSAIGLEYQILDDAKHPDAKKGNNGKGTRTVASLYDLKAAPQDKPINAVGEWNTAHIVSKDGKVEHWLNGEKILEYDRFSDEFAQRIENSKYKDWDGFGVWEQGHILLQDHGNEVHFKNIKVKDLPAS